MRELGIRELGLASCLDDPVSQSPRRPPPRGTATFLAAGSVFVVAWLAGLLARDHPTVGLLGALMIVAAGVLCLVGAALYLIDGPRRRLPVRRVVLLAGVVPAVVVVVVALAD